MSSAIRQTLEAARSVQLYTALDLVREAIAQGSDCLFGLHRNMDFGSLRGHPRF